MINGQRLRLFRQLCANEHKTKDSDQERARRKGWSVTETNKEIKYFGIVQTENRINGTTILLKDHGITTEIKKTLEKFYKSNGRRKRNNPTQHLPDDEIKPLIMTQIHYMLE